LEFTGSPTGLTCEELLLRYKRFENAKMSYWRSEERRRVRPNSWYDLMHGSWTPLGPDAQRNYPPPGIGLGGTGRTEP
jgi:hypothetical protein